MLKTRTVYSIDMRHTFAFLSADTRHDKIMVFENFGRCLCECGAAIHTKCFNIGAAAQ